MLTYKMIRLRKQNEKTHNPEDEVPPVVLHVPQDGIACHIQNTLQHTWAQLQFLPYSDETSFIYTSLLSIKVTASIL